MQWRNMKSPVLLCTVRSCTNNSWIDSKMLQLTQACQQWWSDGLYDLTVIDNYADINNYVEQYDWIVVQGAGDIITDRDYLQYKLETIDPSIGIVAHLLWYQHEDNCPYIHHQCFIINTKAIKNFITFNNDTDRGKCLVRSTEDLHDGHAPLSVCYGEEIIDRNKKFGTNLILEVLDNGYLVQNFDLSWRFNPARTLEGSEELQMSLKDFKFPSIPTRGYIWPEIETEQYQIALETLEINESLDPLQKSVIQLFKESLNYNFLNVIHWDEFTTTKTFECVIAPANGMLGETMALVSHAKKIIFYDINKHNIEFKKFLYNEWDGSDYYKVAETYARNKNLKIEPSTENGVAESLKSRKDVDNILQNWDYFRSLDVEFLHIDLIKDIDEIISKINQPTLIHTSTIMTYFIFSHISHTSEVIRTSRFKLEEKIKNTRSEWVETK